MNNLKKENNIIKYLKTISFSLFLAGIGVIISLCIIQHNIYNAHEQKDVMDTKFEYSLINLLIDKNKYIEATNPKDYKINLRLGVLYEIIKNKKEAEKQYLISIKKAPFGEYKPSYRLALFYVRNDRISEAQKIINSIEDKPSKKLIFYKGEIYKKIGDAYYNKGNYVMAINALKRSLYYYEKIKTNEINETINSLASAYVYYSDECLENGKIYDAVNSLKLAMVLKNSSFINYKFALALSQVDLEGAAVYFDKVFKTTPQIINSDVYTAFLDSLSNELKRKGRADDAGLYEYRKKSYLRFIDENILVGKDIGIFITNKKAYYSFGKLRVNSDIQIQNNSNYDFKTLYIKLIYKEGSTILQEMNTPQLSKIELKQGALTNVTNVQFNKRVSKKMQNQNPITITVIAYKNEKYPLSLTTFNIYKPSKESRK